MDIKVVSFIEEENGTASVQVELDEEAKIYLINYAFNNLVEKGLTEIEALHHE